ncbi:MAG TPA: NfeD family protein [Polyangia bacterium]|nr:NfeD family protein [Polyangia bacterium]
MALLIIALLVVALILLVAEVLVIPGFGVAGVLGVTALLGGVALAFLYLGMLWGAGAVGASVAIAGSTLWLLPRTELGRELVLQHTNRQAAPRPELQALVGQRGVALTTLRPAGAVEIAGQRVDVVTDGSYIDAGTPVKVVAVQGARVVVEQERTGA